MARAAAFLAATAAVILAGCASRPVRVVDTEGGALARSVEAEDSHIAADPALAPAGAPPPDDRPLLFVVAEPEWAAREILDEEKRGEILFTLRERTYRYLLRSYPHPARARWAYLDADPVTRGYRVVHVRSRVAEARGGSALARYFIGFGAGASKVRLEGELLEGEDGARLLGRFAVEASNGGYTNWGNNFSVLKDSYTLKYAVDEAVARFASEMTLLLPPPPADESQAPGAEFATAQSEP
ncbi:MAG: DUF4410 domain-containing protein [Candidatus Sumerlaeia bacterium]|nr:DUF4410 domain-containing protein [Candidatus Sumerlaeia bacterium]